MKEENGMMGFVKSVEILGFILIQIVKGDVVIGANIVKMLRG
jgi:hypothetical protein